MSACDSLRCRLQAQCFLFIASAQKPIKMTSQGPRGRLGALKVALVGQGTRSPAAVCKEASTPGS